MFTIAIFDANDSVSEVTLDGTVYQLHMAWNSECEFWSWGLLDADGNTLIDALALVPDYPLIDRIRTPDLPLGELCAITPDGRNTISYTDLVSGTVSMTYLELSDLE